MAHDPNNLMFIMQIDESFPAFNAGCRQVPNTVSFYITGSSCLFLKEAILASKLTKRVYLQSLDTKKVTKYICGMSEKSMLILLKH